MRRFENGTGGGLRVARRTIPLLSFYISEFFLLHAQVFQAETVIASTRRSKTRSNDNYHCWLSYLLRCPPLFAMAKAHNNPQFGEFSPHFGDMGRVVGNSILEESVVET
ncbi:hypothetical protein VPH35_082201 [Triticum aestivum]|uniref:Uncharacterized protein n=1 Tax=Triticum turgidum subsp. durum TaxID=4567 RepID=A0A9R0TPL1_TRITD|nr:unnamed protein product [Triticum turgidum subsp. durum]